MAKGRVNGDLASEGSQESAVVKEAVGKQNRGGQAVNLRKSGAGYSKGCCGAKVLETTEGILDCTSRYIRSRE